MYALGGELGMKGLVSAAGGRGAELDMAGYCKKKQSPAGASCCLAETRILELADETKSRRKSRLEAPTPARIH
jgi:hypothetical protein